MTGAQQIREIVVAGSGLVGCSAAAMLKRRIRDANVTLVGPPPGEEALAERIGSTLPSIVGFHHDIGLDEGEVLRATGASFRLGTVFEGWSRAQPSYVHAYGEYGRPLGNSAFHHHWVRLAGSGKAPPFDSHSPAAVLGGAGRFVHPQGDEGSPLAGFEYGLNLDPARYRELMRAFARHLGVAERPAAIADVRIAGDSGFVEALVLEDGSEVAGHLFVDCTGPRALVRTRIDDLFEDWSHWLACDRVRFGAGAGTPDPAPLDKVAAHGAGWRWESMSRAHRSQGLVYSSAHMAEAEAERLLPGESVAFRAGRRKPWARNCVAVGDAAAMIEPLEWTNLHLAHSALDRLVAKIPDRDCSDVELWDYNRECAAEAERVRDFVLLHYVTADRKEAFWREAAAVAPPPSLAHTLSLFRERGRLPLYEEETFTRHSWAAVLLGQGVMPRRVDPLIDAVPPDQSRQAMAQFREMIAAMVPALPTQGDYLRQLAQRGPR